MAWYVEEEEFVFGFMLKLSTMGEDSSSEQAHKIVKHE